MHLLSIWKLGEHGDFQLTEESYFHGLNSVHINKNGHLMFFDNGLKNKISRAVSFETGGLTYRAKYI